MMPHWYQTALEELGTKEIRGPQHSRRVIEYHKATGLGATEDEVSWCGAFVAWTLKQSGVNYSRVMAKSAGARSWLNFGVEIKEPSVGCVVIFWRESRNSWKGHVGFFAGWANEAKTRMKVLGGNQSDMVKFAVYPADRVLGYRWPKEYPLPVGEQPLRTSGVMQGASTAVVGTVAAIGANSGEIVNGLQEVNRLSADGIIGLVAGAVVIIGLIMVIRSRIKGGKEQNKLAEPLKRGS